MVFKRLINFGLFLFLGFCAQFIEGAAAAAAVVSPKLDVSQVAIRQFNFKDPKEVAQAREMFAQSFAQLDEKKPKDPELVEHYRQAFDEEFQDARIKKDTFAYVALFGKKVVGIVLVYQPNYERWRLNLERIATDLSYVRCGIATKMINFLAEGFINIKEIALIPLDSDKVMEFYLKRGFKTNPKEPEQLCLSIKR